MRYSQKLSTLTLSVLFLMGCDGLIDTGIDEYFLRSLKDICGNKDKACISAVEQQFDSCRERYKREWESYMNSSIKEEDKILEIYSNKLYLCIIDENGDPYFYFDPNNI